MSPNPENPIRDTIEGEKTEVIYGVENIINRALQAISTYKHTEDLCTDSNGLAAFIPIEPMRNAAYDLKKRGVKMRWITEITRENIPYCMEVMKFAELRHLDGIRGNFAVHDGREYTASGTLQDGDSRLPRLIYSNVKEIVEQQQYFFETLWNKALPSGQKIKEIEEGIIPDFIETIRDPVEIQNLQLKLINSAEKEMLMIFPTVNIFHQQEQKGLIESLQDLLKRKRGLMIRILTPVDEKIDHVAQIIKDQYQQNLYLQYIVQPMEVTVFILVVDRKFSLSIEVKEKQHDEKWTGSSGDEVIGLATYSNSKSTVLSYASIFESLWRQDELNQQLEKSRDQLDEMKRYLNQVLKEVKHIKE